MATDFPNNPSHGDVFGTFIYDANVPGWRSNPETASGMPAGSIMAWGSDVAPVNWLICNGSAVSRTTYASLFAAIGVTYGVGDGTTTFNLPDLRGKVPVGKDSTQTEFDILGETGGNKATAKYGDGTSTGYGATYSSSLGAGDTTASNLQPYQVVQYIIKSSAGTSAGDSELATRVGATEAVNVTQNTRLTNLEYNSPNYIINGNMDIWQRGTSGTVGGAVGFAADRWQSVTYAGGVMYWFQVAAGTNPAGARYALRIQRASGATNTATMNIAYSLETQDVIKLAGKTVTWSFYARKGSTYSPASSYLNYRATWGTNTDTSIFTGGISGGANIVDTSGVLTDSWQRFTQTFTIPANATSFGVTWFSGVVGTAGASDYYDLTGVQLEESSAATAFRRNTNSLQAELAACQRYYWRFTQLDNYQFWTLCSSWGGEIMGSIKLPVTMRVTPSLSFSDIGSVYWLGNNTNYSGATAFSGRPSKDMWAFACGPNNVPANVPVMMRPYVGTYAEANAEL